MTVIIAGNVGGVPFAASDSLSHGALSLAAAGNAPKCVQLNSRTVAAKAGYGPQFNYIWKELMAPFGSSEPDIQKIARDLKLHGESAYAFGKSMAADQGAVDPGLYLLLSGYGQDGKSHLYWMNYQLKDFGFSSDPNLVLSFGTLADAPEYAQRKLAELARRGGISAQGAIIELTRDVVRREATATPHAVGFPAYVAIAGADGLTIISN